MKKTFLPVLSLAATLPLIATPADAAPTLISGIARNGSKANAPLPGAMVQLIRPANPKLSLPRVTLATTSTDSAGRFTFPARQYAADDLLMANISQGGFDYPVVAYDGAQKLKQVGIDVNPRKVELMVFNTTKKPVPLDYQAHHVAISTTPTGIHCIERIVVENPSTSTLMGVGPRQISLLLDLPKVAKNVKLDPKTLEATPDAKLIDTASGWGVVRPITPDAYGARNAIILSYDMDWPSKWSWGKKIDLSRKTVYPTKFFFVARTTEDKDLLVTAPKLSPDTEAPVPIEGKEEVRLINSLGAPMMPQGGAPPALDAGQDLKISVSKPVSATFWGFAAMTVALCLFLPVAMIKPRRKNGMENSENGKKTQVASQNGNFAEPSFGALVSEQSSGTGPFLAPRHDVGPALALNSQARDLIQKIADLDDRREAGQVGDAEYQTQRAAWKTALIESLGTSIASA